ncbi:MAG: hypothetical protein ACK4TR_13235 [Phenylobacterium sp.]|uniref:hypothetical protein n=1 Tax=Phenylobacterium sp. TaxID=1871053 RepID=UPI00391D3F35
MAPLRGWSATLAKGGRCRPLSLAFSAMSNKPNPRFPRIISDYVRQRLATKFPPREAARLEHHLQICFQQAMLPQKSGRGWAWRALARSCDLDPESLLAERRHVEPLLLALEREIARAPKPAAPRAPRERRSSLRKPRRRSEDDSFFVARNGARPARAPITPELDAWDDPSSFHEALDLHMRRFGETSRDLHAAIRRPGDTLNQTTISAWRRGAKAPRSVESLAVLNRIERRYGLARGYFKAKLPHPSRSATGHQLLGCSAAERRRLAWHLPDDFDARDPSEQEDILRWVRETVVSGSTEYRRFQAAAMKTRYAVRFPQAPTPDDLDPEDEEPREPPDLESASGVVPAPPALSAEMSRLLAFKTSTLTALGFQRNGVWGAETAAQRTEHLSLLFGALAADPRSPVRGYGAPLEHLCFAHLAFPSVWDWYVQWRERRRGFYTRWEVDMLQVAASLTRENTGWLRQNLDLVTRLKVIRGLVDEGDIAAAHHDWSATCSRMHWHALNRMKEIERVARVHRDPFEPILAVLEAESPLAEYRKIVDEIVRLMPDESRYPVSAAEAVRGLLMIRMGLHTGLRQRNLRQLLICHRGEEPTPERRLATLRVGELRWSEQAGAWEVFIPAIAFKNATSSFFGNNPFRLLLPDLGGLYRFIDDYLSRHRPRLLRRAADPGTFFVKTVKAVTQSAAYDQNTFYEAWRLVIQRYGIFNPYTGRGAIKGLLPHGPHNVRDVLATHVLKQTGSYEQASYAIQDTPDVVAKHYGRFLPQDKAALAAQVLNRVWEAA